MAKVELTINHNNGSMCVVKTIDVPFQNTEKQTLEFAELKYCNDYINRDMKVREFTSLSDAKRFSKLRITSKFI